MRKLGSKNERVPESPGQRPVHTLRHRGLKATIWRNDTAKGSIYNVKIIRSYSDRDDKWQDTSSLGYDDLMNVAALMYEAHSFISSLRAKDATDRGNGRR